MVSITHSTSRQPRYTSTRPGTSASASAISRGMGDLRSVDGVRSEGGFVIAQRGAQLQQVSQWWLAARTRLRQRLGGQRDGMVDGTIGFQPALRIGGIVQSGQ